MTTLTVFGITYTVQFDRSARQWRVNRVDADGNPTPDESLYAATRDLAIVYLALDAAR